MRGGGWAKPRRRRKACSACCTAHGMATLIGPQGPVSMAQVRHRHVHIWVILTQAAHSFATGSRRSTVSQSAELRDSNESVCATLGPLSL